MITALRNEVQIGRNLAPGVLASGAVAIAAMSLAQHYRAPVMPFALLLGSRITWTQVAQLGWQPALLVAINSFGWLPETVCMAGQQASQWGAGNRGHWHENAAQRIVYRGLEARGIDDARDGVPRCDGLGCVALQRRSYPWMNGSN